MFRGKHFLKVTKGRVSKPIDNINIYVNHLLNVLLNGKCLKILQMVITAQITFHCQNNVGPMSAHPSVRHWANGFLTVGPMLAQCRQAISKKCILCIVSANQIMFTINSGSVSEILHQHYLSILSLINIRSEIKPVFVYSYFVKVY